MTAAARRTVKRAVAVGFVIALILLLASRWNPMMTSAANNRLEAPCAEPAIDAVIEIDREAWTPLLWSCTVRRTTGETKTIRPW